MSLENLQAMAKDTGVSSGDVQRMYGNGLTENLASDVRQKLGLGVADIWKLFQQFGPAFLTILNTLMPLVKTPEPAPQEPRAHRR